VGKHIASVCGEQLKRVTLELGGKSAAIVLDDVALDDALLNEMVMSGLMNNGQVCGAQSRILAPRSRYDEVVDALASKVGELHVGDPLDLTTQVGPLVAERQRTAGGGLHRVGQARGRGSSPVATGPTSRRLVRGADGVRGCRQHDGHRSARDLRSGAVGDSVRR